MRKARYSIVGLVLLILDSAGLLGLSQMRMSMGGMMDGGMMMR